MTAPLRLERLDTFVVALPIRRVHRWVGLDTPVGAGYVITRARLSDGTVGWGEAQAIKTWGGDDWSRYGDFAITRAISRDVQRDLGWVACLRDHQ